MSAFDLMKSTTSESVSHEFKAWENLEAPPKLLLKSDLYMFVELFVFCIQYFVICCISHRNTSKEYIDFTVSFDEGRVKVLQCIFKELYKYS